MACKHILKKSTPETKKHHLQGWAFLIAIFMALAIVGSSVSMLWGITVRQEQSFIDYSANETLILTKRQIEDRLRNYEYSFIRMADSWRYHDQVIEQEWRYMANNLIETEIGLQAIEWLDQDFSIRFIEPEEARKKVPGDNMMARNIQYHLIKRATEKKQVFITHPTKLTDNYTVFSLYVPIHKNDEFKGFLVGIFDVNEFFQGAISNLVLRDYDIIVKSGDNLFFQSGEVSRNNSERIFSDTFKTNHGEWHITLAPKKVFVNFYHNKAAKIIFIATGLIVILIASSFYYAYLSYSRSAKLADSEEMTRSIIHSAVDGLITIDTSGIIRSFNPACERLFGYMAEEVIGRNVKTLMPDPYRAEHDGYLNNYKTTGEKQIIGIGREVEAMRKDGKTFPIDLSVSEIKLSGQTMFGGIIRDITIRKSLENSIKEANAELEEFAYRTSHDLRSPIVSSLGLLDITEEAVKDGDKDEALGSLVLVQKSLRKLETLIEDILILTQTKNADQEKDKIDVFVAIKDATEKLNHMKNFERLEIREDIQVKEIVAQRIRFNTIVENLISNAIKYQDTRKEASYIQVSTYKQDDMFVMDVKDNGLGVPKGMDDKLFTMFKRFHTKVSFGSGLGLYLMKKSAEAMGGSVGFERHDEGSIFRLTLPLRDDESEARE